MLHDLFFYKMSVNFMDSISCRIRWNFSKFNHFREDFHIMLSELREIPGNCQRSVHFPEIFRGSEIFEIFSKSGRQKLGLASRDLGSFVALVQRWCKKWLQTSVHIFRSVFTSTFMLRRLHSNALTKWSHCSWVWPVIFSIFLSSNLVGVHLFRSVWEKRCLYLKYQTLSSVYFALW